uniref:Abnormal cell migration protein 18-like fibronectin type I domain-containing protein n=1 Tax=Romanomermis culicivorax TaxID=13658 RepID=A0A915IBG8_ROMCU
MSIILDSLIRVIIKDLHHEVIMLNHKLFIYKIFFYCLLEICDSFLDTLFQSPTQAPDVASSTASANMASIMPIASSNGGTAGLCQAGQEIQNGGFISQCNGKFYATVACLLPSNGVRVPIGSRANDGNFEYICVSDGSTTSLKSTACIIDGQRLEPNYAMAVGDFYKGCYQSPDDFLLKLLHLFE